MNTIKLGGNIGIIGTQSISKSKHGDSTKIEIISSGISQAYKIPSVIVFCEDKVAEELIANALSHKDMNVGSFKFRRCGSWSNIIVSLAGCILYSEELIKSGNTKALEVIGVIDGDISANDIQQVISETYEGDFIPEQLKNITNAISSRITSFKIPNDVLSKRNTRGKPELNLKNMVEEITSEMTKKPFHKRVEELKGYLEIAKDDNNKKHIEFELDDIYKEIDETLEIINISKKIAIHERDGVFNYHPYFKKLEKETNNTYYINYNYTHHPIFLVYKIVSKFNTERWEEYITPVTEFLKSVAKRQQDTFSHNTYNNTEID
ncbi:hypothetical protein EDF81_0091 [Enterobacter sp. BIGb0383]|uniref:hypothetical protein n=1 Tax=unclassified Enterobacter TaxID=2608935 RepID=UPI000F4648F3|nr:MULTISPECIES: hypothetical protein [unclassified Enterobacter]ROP61620.1 hypothetical protein EDF81_0091 [Enterobacter sp. BIGb0383]ROS11781.1 hypothetical protein EC848_0091 [Enterobacter sp. BIGb0359]